MTDNKTLEQAQKICRNLLDLDPPETPEKIKDSIEKVNRIIPLTEEEKEHLLARLLEVTGTTQDAPRILDNDAVQPWVLDRWSMHSDHRRFWKRYRDYLTDEQKIPSKIVSRLDELTDNILDRLADPEAHDQFDKRGLIVGHVQSGKTSNYIGLITKAADAGYKLIVVLAGIHNSLRSQTQLRIDEGFLGYDTVTSRSFDQSTNRMGVGRFDPNVPAHSLTSSAPNGDFKKNLADVNIHLNGSDPVIIVIKKNSSVLKNLIQWLATKEGEDFGDGEKIIKNIPLLLIDDEADNASINISKSSVSAINGSIRALLQLFKKSAYVGYTATPYANVFIPPPVTNEELRKGIKIKVGTQEYHIGEDLFPRNFIVNIPPPSNYIGPEKFFGILNENSLYENHDTDQKSPIYLYEPVSDYQPADYFSSKIISDYLRQENNHFIPDRHKKDDAKPEILPESLKKAIRVFILSCAARRVRGQINVHNSMLIHVTRFVDWQNHIALLVDEELRICKTRIEFQQTDFFESLRQLWKEDFQPKMKAISESPDFADTEMTTVSWSDVEYQLLPAVTKIRTRAVHGSTLLGGLEPENIQALDYYENRKKGLSVIAIGGNKLSRGLTLEGLTVSYYLRASKMYDTLMQMGRWFGYRPGYLDLCRIFTSDDLISHYRHITLATEEMRAEFDRMWLLHKKPIDFGLKVRAHTGVLAITASNKFRYKKMMSFSFSGGLKETWQFDTSTNNTFEHNYALTLKLIEGLGHPTGPLNDSKHLISQKFVWYGENNFQEVLDYLNDYRSTQSTFYTRLLHDYISKFASEGKLTNWTIAVINNSTISDGDKIPLSESVKVGLSFRKDDAQPGNPNYELVKSHIIGNFHEYIDLDNNQIETALLKTMEDRKQEGKNPEEIVHPSPLRIRENRKETNGLLLIYPLNPRPRADAAPYSEVPIVGIALSFPYIEGDLGVLYAVNEVFIKNLYDYPEELDTEDLTQDEDEESKNVPQVKDIPGKETFNELIEVDLNRRQNLDEIEFFSGIVPRYISGDERSAESDQAQNLVITTGDRKGFKLDAVPYYTEKEIQRYFLNETTENLVLSLEPGGKIEGEYLVGLKRSKYVTFAFHNTAAAFSDSCWIIRSGRLNARYLASLFNSTLFGAWVRICGEQKKDTYFIKNDVLYKFPVVLPPDENIWLYESLYELLVAAGKKEQKAGAGTMKAFYSSILDALVFSCYFPESMKKEADILYSSLSTIIPRELPVGKDRQILAVYLFDTFYNKKHPVREVLYFLGNHRKVSRIKSIFTS